MLISWNGSLSTVCPPDSFYDYRVLNSIGLVIVFEFYTNLNEFYGVITECCTSQACPTMSAGRTCVSLFELCDVIVVDGSPVFYWKSRLNYTWINQDRKSVNLAAPTYIDYVMTWIQNLLNDEATFPTKAGQFFFQSSKTLNNQHCSWADFFLRS
jgi:hypothetical protein